MKIIDLGQGGWIRIYLNEYNILRNLDVPGNVRLFRGPYENKGRREADKGDKILHDIGIRPSFALNAQYNQPDLIFHQCNLSRPNSHIHGPGSFVQDADE